VRDEGRLLQDVNARFEVESYLEHQGGKFVDRFDANSYIYLSRMMDLYDASAGWPSLGASLDLERQFAVDVRHRRLEPGEPDLRDNLAQSMNLDQMTDANGQLRLASRHGDAAGEQAVRRD